jgi:hypothetical protein
MSLVFSNTSTKNGIIQRIEKTCGFNDGDISGNATRLAQFTGDVNVAMDRALSLIFQVGGTWQFDDSNHSDYPIITTDLVSGQRDYPLTTDGSGNLVLEIYKVMVADEHGNYRVITPVDVPDRTANSNYWDGLNVEGQPNTYDKLGNSIILDPIPNYNQTAGLKVYINRESTYFTVSDTTKKAGFAGLFHDYLVIHPSYQHALRNLLPTTKSLSIEVEKMEFALQDYYKSREKDVNKVLRAAYSSSR